MHKTFRNESKIYKQASEKVEKFRIKFCRSVSVTNPKTKKRFRKNEIRHFSGKCPDIVQL